MAKGTECFNKEAKVLDAHLAKQPYLVGKEMTLADFSVAAPLFYADRASCRWRLMPTPGLVRPRLGAAVLARDRAATFGRGGVNEPT